jgi:spermidine synthase
MLVFNKERILFEKQTLQGYCQVVEKIYSHRPARLLYSGKVRTAQSGIALDDSNLMLFGYNQRFIEIVDQMEGLKNILLIGGGVYTLPTSISALNDFVNIDIVEPNEELDEIAVKYFEYKTNSKTMIYHVGGQEFLKTSTKKYDLIIIDAYHEDQIPEDFQSISFTKLIKQALSIGGTVAFNIISSLRPDSPINKFQEYYASEFSSVVVYSADHEKSDYYYDQNFVLVASDHSIDFRLKYPPLASSVN